jgi:hypothetical protein
LTGEAEKARVVVLPALAAMFVAEEDEREKGRVEGEVPDEVGPRLLREAGYLRKPVNRAEGIGLPAALSNS